MILVKRIYTRPSPAAPWHFEVVTTGLDEFKQHMSEKYKDSLHYSQYIDETTFEFMSIWETMEEYEAYAADPILWIFWTARDNYNESVNITSIRTIEEI